MTGNLISTFLLLVFATSLAAQRAKQLTDYVGIYHWGGKYADGYTPGIRDVISVHAKIARITVSPGSNIDYNRSSSCTPDFTLSRALEDPDLLSALADPHLEVVMITAYGGSEFGGCSTLRYLNPQWYTPENAKTVADEYSDFVYRLHVLFQGTGKRFIISNWEGDNAIYCGQASAYANSSEFREQCLASYPQVFSGNRNPHDSMAGMVRWLNVRYLGVRAGRARASHDGLTGVSVHFAPEFNAVHMLRDRGMESVLFDVLPQVSFDYVSYSSYESLGSEDPATTLRADLTFIQSLAGTDRIIVGEFGFSRFGSGERQIELTCLVTRAAIEWGAQYVIQWNLYDQDPQSDFGLFDLSGNISELGRYYRRVLSRSGPGVNSVSPLTDCAHWQ